MRLTYANSNDKTSLTRAESLEIMSEASIFLQSWILDYACCHHFESIIQGISRRNNGHLESLDVCHSRLACSTIHFIIHKEQFSYFDTIIKTIKQLRNDFPSHMIDQNVYNRLVIGLKIKSLFHELECNFGNVLLKLNVYFPREPINNGNEMSEKQRNFRKFFLSLIANKSQRKTYLNNEFHSDFGSNFMESIKNLTDKFLSNLETYLMPPVIDVLLASDNFQNLPVLSPETEMLLDFIYDVKNQQNGGKTPEGEQKEKTLMFKEQDLLHMLNLLCPIDPEELPSIDHHINLTRLVSDSISLVEEKPPMCSDQIQSQEDSLDEENPPMCSDQIQSQEDSLDEENPPMCSDQIQSQEDSSDEDFQQNEQDRQGLYTLIYISSGEDSVDIETCSEKSTSSLTQETNKLNLETEIKTDAESLQEPEIEIDAESLQKPDTETYSEPLQTNLENICPKSLCDLSKKEMNLVGSDALVLQSTSSKSSDDEQTENISVKNSTIPSHSNNYLQNDLSFDHNFSSESDIFQSLSDSSSDCDTNYNFVCPPGSDSEQIFYCGNLFDIDPNQTSINKQPEKGTSACKSKLFRNEI